MLQQLSFKRKILLLVTSAVFGLAVVTGVSTLKVRDGSSTAARWR
jgi:hypothetical protein